MASKDEWLEAFVKLMGRFPFDEASDSALEVFRNEPERVGAEFVRFVKNGGRVERQNRKWEEVDGNFHFSLKSDGTRGDDWSKRLARKGFQPSSKNHGTLLSNNYIEESPSLHLEKLVPTDGVVTDIVVVNSEMFVKSINGLQSVCERSSKAKIKPSNFELLCLARDKFTDAELDEMNLWWLAVMFNDPDDLTGVKKRREEFIRKHGQEAWDEKQGLNRPRNPINNGEPCW